MTLTVAIDQPTAPAAPAVVSGPSPARDRATRSMGGIAKLFAERPELRGVHAPADLADDAIRWSA